MTAVSPRLFNRFLRNCHDDDRLRRFDVFPSINGERVRSAKHNHQYPCDNDGVVVSSWSTPSVTALRTPLTGHGVTSIAVHSEGVWAVSGRGDGILDLWSARVKPGTVAFSKKISEVCKSNLIEARLDRLICCLSTTGLREWLAVGADGTAMCEHWVGSYNINHRSQHW